MRLLDLIKQDHTIRFTANGFGQLTTFIISYISRRRTYESAYTMFLLIFTHIDTSHHTFIIKQKLSERFSQFGLADAGCSKKNE